MARPKSLDHRLNLQPIDEVDDDEFDDPKEERWNRHKDPNFSQVACWSGLAEITKNRRKKNKKQKTSRDAVS